jgi:hypothetical protein
MNNWELFDRAYGEIAFEAAAATTCDSATSFEVMLPFLDVARQLAVPVISENYPCFTSGALDGGIYRWKLPTVYDMAEWIRAQQAPVDWRQFREEYYQAYRPSLALLNLVHQWWEAGELFQGTAIAGSGTSSTSYEPSMDPSTVPRRTLVVRRIGRR